MGKIKFGRVLIPAILGALSLVAMFAVSAQAASPEFQISLKPALLATVTGSLLAGFLLVAGRNLKLNCTGGKLEEKGEGTGITEITNEKHGLAVIAFEGCTALNHKTGAELPCTLVKQPLAITLAKPILIGGTEPGILFEPDATSKEGEKGRFVTVEFVGGGECPLPESNPVTGEAVALIDNNDTKEVLLLFSEAIQKAASAVLKFGGFEAFVNTTAHLTLTGTHTGLSFGVA
jgi:hypothetical protein